MEDPSGCSLRRWLRHERNGHRDAARLGVARHGRDLAAAPLGEGRDRGRRRARRRHRGGRAALVALHRAQRGLASQPRAGRAVAGLDPDARPAALVRSLARADRRRLLGHGRRRADRVRLPREPARALAAHLRTPRPEPIPSALVVVDAVRRLACVPEGTALDLGRVARMWSAERAAAIVRTLSTTRRSCSRSATTWSPCAATTSSP